MRQALTILAVGIGFAAMFVAGINLGAHFKSEPAQTREPATTQQKITTLENTEENKPNRKPPQANPVNKTPPKTTSTKEASVIDRPNWLSASLAKIRPEITASATPQTSNTENKTSLITKSPIKGTEQLVIANKNLYAIQTKTPLNITQIKTLTNELTLLNYDFYIIDQKLNNKIDYKFIRISGFIGRNIALKTAADLSSKTGQTFIAFRIPAAPN